MPCHAMPLSLSENASGPNGVVVAALILDAGKTDAAADVAAEAVFVAEIEQQIDHGRQSAATVRWRQNCRQVPPPEIRGSMRS